MKNETIAKGNYEAYLRSEKYSLSDAYDRPSTRKEAAWEYCRNLCAQYEGWGLKVISKNTFIFTAGFLFLSTSGKEKFMYITPSYNHVCDVG